MTQQSELLIILADYSNDLSALKKRNGKLPADAAVERLESIITKACNEAKLEGRELELRILDRHIWEQLTPQFTTVTLHSLVQYIDKARAAILKQLEEL